MKIIISFLLICICKIAWAQLTFQKTYGGDVYEEAYSFTQTADGGAIIVGYTTQNTIDDEDVYLVKTDADGHLLWTKTFGGAGSDNGSCVQQTSDEGFIITGFTESFGTGRKEIYLIRTSSIGDTLWTKTFGKPNHWAWGNSVTVTNDGGFLITGNIITDSDTTLGDIVLIRTDALGDTLWTRIIGSASTGETGNSGQQTSDGGFIITGVANGFGAGENDLLLLKTDNSGIPLWAKTLGGENLDRGTYVEQTADGGYIVNGYTMSFGVGECDLFLFKTDSAGEFKWCKTYGGPLHEFIHSGNSLDQTSDGGYILVGWSWNFGLGGDEGYIIKTNSQGDTLWTKVVSGPNSEIFCGVQETSDHGYILAGTTASFPPSPVDFFLVRTDDLGNSGCNTFNTSTIVSETGFDITNPVLQYSSGLTILHPATQTGVFGSDTTLCTTVGMTRFSSDVTVTVFPNPVYTQTTIRTNRPLQDATVTVCNALGQVVLFQEKNCGQEIVLRRGNLPCGLYLVSIMEGNAIVATEIVIFTD